jgi:Fe-S cluster biogenesis protein NfuA/nitrite reductase/ring-hydroxylating ferredoxin subunit
VEDAVARERIGRLEALLAELEELPDPAARERATAAIQALLDLYGEGLGRIVEHVAARDDGTLAEAFADDELVSHLLLLHDLHPVPLAERVAAALAEVRPYLASHGGDVELLGADDGIVRLRLTGTCDGCPSSAATLELAIEEAIHKAAPDVEAIETEGAAEPRRSPPIQLEVGEALRKRWTVVADPPRPTPGSAALCEVEGEPVLFVRLRRSLYAYRPACPACGTALAEGPVAGTLLACAGCGHRYDAARAGRCADDDALQLEPVPLLQEAGGGVKLALGARAAA